MFKTIGTIALLLGSVSMSHANVIEQFTATPNVITVGDQTTFDLQLSLFPDACCSNARFAANSVVEVTFGDGSPLFQELITSPPETFIDISFVHTYSAPQTYTANWTTPTGIRYTEVDSLGNTVFADPILGGATGVTVNAVPGPVAGAGLPGLILACGILLTLARRRRQIAC